MVLVVLSVKSQNQQQFDRLNKTINTTNYCLYKFKKEKNIAIITELAGLGAVIYANSEYLNGKFQLAEDYKYDVLAAGDRAQKIRDLTKEYNGKIDHINDNCKILTYVGCGLILSGAILHVHSNRWLERAYVVPLKNGVAVDVRFNF